MVKFMAKFWQSSGKAMAKLWQSYGEVMAKFWQNSCSARFGKVVVEKRYALAAWLLQGAGKQKVCLGSLASPRRREAFEAWQGAIRPFRNGTK